MQLQGNNTDPIKHMRPDMGSVTTEHAIHGSNSIVWRSCQNTQKSEGGHIGLVKWVSNDSSSILQF